MAVREGHAEVVELLLRAGADPGQSRYTYNSWDKLLAIAEERGCREVRALLEAAMRERFCYDTGFAALAEAIKDRDGDRVEALLAEQPGFIRAADAFGNGPLHWAVLTRQNDLMDLLVSRGADLEARRADGQTSLLVSLNGDYWYRTRDLPPEAPKDSWTVTRHLLECGAEYVLSIACAVGDEDRVDAVLAADPAQARGLDAGRRSPLSCAARRGHTRIVEKLLDNGADPNRPEELAPPRRGAVRRLRGEPPGDGKTAARTGRRPQRRGGFLRHLPDHRRVQPRRGGRSDAGPAARARSGYALLCHGRRGAGTGHARGR